MTLVVLTQLVYYGTPWLVWNGRQAVLFDLAERKFYIFGLVLWPQDFIFLTGLLVISALSLFLFTAIGDRGAWCHARLVLDERGAPLRLEAPRVLSLDDAIEYIGDDELVEVTPKSFRLRKKLLIADERKREQKRRDMALAGA